MCECERSSRNVIVFQRAVRMSLIVQRIMTAVAALSVPVLIAACGARSTNSSNETFRKGERFCFLPLAVSGPNCRFRTTKYSPTAGEFAADKPVVRPVLGGTGKYTGARGQATTTRNADGSYTQVFTLFK